MRLALNLYNGFKFGFPLHFEGSRISIFGPNLVSAQRNPEIVSARLSKELAVDRLAGPFNSPPFPNFRVSPLGLVPKKAPGEYRLIHLFQVVNLLMTALLTSIRLYIMLVLMMPSK